MASEEKTEKSSPTASGPDSDIGSVKELPQDEETGIFLYFFTFYFKKTFPFYFFSRCGPNK